MAELKLNFAGKLSCGKCEEVLLWLHNPTKLAANAGVTDPSQQTQLIPGEITDVVTINSANYQYTVEYDENLLLNPGNLLIECDIKQLCCAGCTIQYVDEAIRSKDNSILVDNTVADPASNSFTHTSGDGTVTTVNFGHSLSQAQTGDEVTLTLTKPDGTEDEVVLTLPAPGGSFSCDPDFETWLDCLESVKDGVGCTYDVDPLNGRFDAYPLTLTRIETVDGDVVFNISGNSLTDLVVQLNAQSGVTGYTFVESGNLLRILSAPAVVNRVEFSDGTDFDWRPAALVPFSCSQVDPRWERFCACVNRCVDYQIFLEPAPNENLLTLQGSDGSTSTVDLCPAVERCLEDVEALSITDGTNTEAIDLGDTVTFGGGASIEHVVSATDTVTTNLLLSADDPNFAELSANDGNLLVTPSGDANNFVVPGTDGRMYVFPSTDPNNSIVVGSDGGIFVDVPAQAVATDNTINGDGTPGDPLSVCISADANNGLTLGTDGCLYAAPGAETVTTFTDNGDGTFTYVSEDGTATVICQGPNNVVVPGDPCETVGANNMVRDVQINGCDLTVVSAPEHTAVEDYAEAERTIDVNGPTNFPNFLGLIVSITNPSPCRDMIVKEDFRQNEWRIQVPGSPSPTQIRLDTAVQRSVDGAPFVGIHGGSHGQRITNFVNNGNGIFAVERPGQTQVTHHVLAPGATLTIEYNVIYNLLELSSANPATLGAHISSSLIGWTV